MSPRKKRRRKVSSANSTIITSSTNSRERTPRKILLRCINPDQAFRDEPAFFRIEVLGDLVRDASTDEHAQTCPRAGGEDLSATPQQSTSSASQEDENILFQKFPKYDLRAKIKRPKLYCGCCNSSKTETPHADKAGEHFPRSCVSISNEHKRQKKWGEVGKGSQETKLLPHRFRIVYADPDKDWHYTEKKSQCPYCPDPYCVQQGRKLKEHIAKVHPFRCCSCKVDFKHQLEKKIHRIHEHLEVQHRCVVCEKIFMSERSYERHSKSEVHKKMLDVQWRTLATVLHDFFNLDVPVREDLSHPDLPSTLRLVMARPDVRQVCHKSPALEQFLAMLRTATAATLEEPLIKTNSAFSGVSSKPPLVSPLSREVSLASVQPKKWHSSTISEGTQNKAFLKSFPEQKEKSVAIVHPLCRNHDTTTDYAQNNVEKHVHMYPPCVDSNTLMNDFSLTEESAVVLQTRSDEDMNALVQLLFTGSDSADRTGTSVLENGVNILMPQLCDGYDTSTDATALQAGSENIPNKETQCETVYQSLVSSFSAQVLSVDNVNKNPQLKYGRNGIISRLEKSQDSSGCFTLRDLDTGTTMQASSKIITNTETEYYSVHRSPFSSFNVLPSADIVNKKSQVNDGHITSKPEKSDNPSRCFISRDKDTATDHKALQAGSSKIIANKEPCETLHRSSVSIFHALPSADIVNEKPHLNDSHAISKAEKYQDTSRRFTQSFTATTSSKSSEEVLLGRSRLASPEVHVPQLPNSSSQFSVVHSNEMLPNNYWNGDCSPLPNVSYFSRYFSTPLKHHSSSTIEENPGGMSTPVINVMNSPFQLPSPQRVLVTARKNAFLYNEYSGIISDSHCQEFEDLWQSTSLEPC